MEKDVHTEHCCQIHGCKYPHQWDEVTKTWSKPSCTVANLTAPQSFPCEWCLDDEEFDEAYKLNEMFNRGRAFGYFEKLHEEVK